ncbi:MAG: exodeoxyribonuclease VII large subunit [Pseudomonadota bacterium]
MIEDLDAAPPRAAWSVAALLREIGDLVVGRFSVCTVTGEISGLSRAASGHVYFNLKDADGAAALLRCAMFRRSAGMLAFVPADGQRVEVRGRLGVYEPRGELQVVVEGMRTAGAGALYEEFLRSKARLEAQGLFDRARKRALPPYPRTVGIVSSLGAAALHDVLTALARRAPQVQIIVYPSLVQGADAPQALVRAITLASTRAEVDVLIVCRGGGSLEDLWAFNDEQVVRAIAASSVPVVCGVGHETDVTLADFAADLRAATPTAAAELVAPTREACLSVLDALAALLQRRVRDALELQAQRLDRNALRLARPGHAVRQQRERLLLLGHRLAVPLPRAMQSQQARLTQAEVDLRRGLERRLAGQQQQLQMLAARLRALDPRQVLARGYAWLSDADARPVTSVHQLAIGAALQVVLHDGSADVAVTGVGDRTSA